MINMINAVNESDRPVKKDNNNDKGLQIKLLDRQQKYKEAINPQADEVELISLAMMKTHVNKQSFKMQNEIAKLIKLYSRTGSTDGLTRQEFKILAKDLYGTVDKDRKLSEQQLNNLVNLLDTDKDELISRSQLRDIVEDKSSLQGQKSR